jgi:fermentation-respiration switch protein FrsA (DUF1100 family)
LYARTPEPKSLKLIPGGGHNDSATVGGADYLSAITDFVATNVDAHPLEDFAETDQ